MKRTARTRLIETRKNHRWSQQDVAKLLGTTRHNVSRWEAGLTCPGPYFRARLCGLFEKQAQDLDLLDEPQAPSPHHASSAVGTESLHDKKEQLALWVVPYPRNPYFTGREELLARLDQQFAPTGDNSPFTAPRVALIRAQAITGLGGIGKTQIALEYAYHSYERNRYTHILWINASNEETIMASFATIAEALSTAGAAKEIDQRKQVEVIKRWLEQCPEPWLLIVDNAADLSLLQPLLPQWGNGNLLFTTRAHAVGSLATALVVENMDMAEGTTFLLQRAQRLSPDEDERDEAINVVIALDGFPLALDQAGAYIEETGCDFKAYLQLYQEHHQILLAQRGRQATGYPDSVGTTWSLSFQQIEATNPAAAELLYACALLAPDAIPEELFSDNAACWPPALQQAVVNRLSFHHILESLLCFSLIKRRLQDRTLSLHRLVQVVQQDAMKPEELLQWAERVVRAVHALFPANPKADAASWPRCLRYLDQVQVCDMLIQQFDLRLPEAAELLDRAGTYLSEHASYALAEPLHQRAIQIWERTLGPEHLSVAVPLNNLASLYLYQGKYAQAEQLFRRALTIREQWLGENHLLVAQPLTNLAVLYSKQEKYAEAEVFFQRTLHLLEQLLGSEHFDLTYPLNGLAELYRRQKNYLKAEPLFLRALHLREQHLGAEHPLVAHPLNNLAEVYKEQGRHIEAEPLFERALAIWEKQMGAEHPLVAYPLTNLAEIYTKQGRQVEAESLFERALSIRERALGPHHLDTAETLQGLASLRVQQGNTSEAGMLYQRVLTIREQILGPEHPITAATRTAYLALIQEKEEAPS